MKACPGVREEVGDCEGLPPPCIERRETHVAATLLLIGAIFGGLVWAYVQVTSELADNFH